MTDIEQLYKDCYQRMLTVARQMLKNDDEASDTVSNVFARLADGSLMLPAERPESYLTVTVRHLCLDRIRLMTIHERMERRLSLTDDDPTSEEKERERVAEMIDYAKRTFPKQTWRVFQLRFDEGLLYREIAERLGISEVSVYKHLAEALRQLKEKFNPTRR
jgi:RNA polymerase sigma-70 factor (ECF subfamily)